MKRIGLIDVDCHAEEKRFGQTIYPNLALCKIAAWHKKHGDEVEWANPMDHYDIIYMSKIFNFTPDDRYVYDADVIVKGGTGYDVNKVLPYLIDDMQPDLSIYPNLPADTSYGFLTRGCPNKCYWCVVPKKEGLIKPYWDVDRVANGRHNLILMDNNILAAGDYCTDQLQKIIERKYAVDFNQALDARLVNEENAKLLARIKWIKRRIRFGCDTPGQIKECERAIGLLEANGYKGEVILYTMLGSNYDECYKRLNFWRDRLLLCRELHSGINAFPHSQPYRDPMNANATIPQWQKDMARWCNGRSIFLSTPFYEYVPRKDFCCSEYKTPSCRV